MAKILLVFILFAAVVVPTKELAAQQSHLGQGPTLPHGSNSTNSAAPFYIELAGLDLSTTPPTRDPRNPIYPPAKELPDGVLPTKQQSGNFIIGPSHFAAREVAEQPGVPKGKVYAITVLSAGGTIYTPGVIRAEKTKDSDLTTAKSILGDPSSLVITSSVPGAWKRTVQAYVPAWPLRRDGVPFMVVGDGNWAFDEGRQLFTVVDKLIAEKRIPAMVVILVDAGGQDAQGSERGREYDTVSGSYAQWVEAEILPLIEQRIGMKLTHDPSARATIGLSSSGSAAFTMAWFRPDLYRRVLAYSPTFVNQQWPRDPARRGGAWEYHSRWPGPVRENRTTPRFPGSGVADASNGAPLVPNTPRKPIRFWFQVGDKDLFYPRSIMPDGMHDWVLANENMAKALAGRGYEYQFLFARNASHVDRSVVAQTLPAALEWLWSGYPRPVE